MPEIMLLAFARDCWNTLVALVVLALAYHLLLQMIGFHYAKIMDKLDDDSLAVGIFLSTLLFSVALIVSHGFGG